MCGIVGIVSNNTQLVQQQKLQLMAIALRHRGPDGEGFWINKNNTVGLAHRRLSIIDLSNNAAQPMSKSFTTNALDNEVQRYTIVYNGEIYNYVELRQQLQQHGYTFTTQSDTEVILAAYDFYKDACVEYFDGMFAFAIWDNDLQQLFAARDRFGEKPFYYFFNGEQFVFASEMKALWAAGIAKEVSNTMLLNYISLGLVSNPTNNAETFYKNIYKLPAASKLFFTPSINTLSIKKYWDINISLQTTITDEKKLIEQFQELLQQSVQRRLRSDVAVGTSLSGGLDSSSIVATIQQTTSNTKHQTNGFQQTFSAIFPGFEKDESAHIQKVTNQFGLVNHGITPTSNDLVNDFEKLMYHQEEPFQSSSIYAQYKVYELAKQHDVTVLLDGQGADEILGGYTKYYHWYWQQLIGEKKFSILKNEITQTKQNNIAVDWGFKNYIAAFFPTLAAGQLQNRAWQQLQSNNNINASFIEANANKQYLQKPVIQNLNSILYYNTMQFGLEELLRYADRNSMAHGREVRLPFLSHQLVEFIFALPASMKIRDGFTKHILRASMNNFLPKDIVWRKDKVGFEPPQQQWMQNNQLQEMIHESKKKLVQQQVLNNAVLTKNIQPKAAHAANNFDWWCLCAGEMMKSL